MTAASERTELERRVALAIYDAASMLGYPGDVDRETAPILARAAIAECFRWQPIETAPVDAKLVADEWRVTKFGKHVIQAMTTQDGRTILLRWNNDRGLWTWLLLPENEG